MQLVISRFHWAVIFACALVACAGKTEYATLYFKSNNFYLHVAGVKTSDVNFRGSLTYTQDRSGAFFVEGEGSIYTPKHVIKVERNRLTIDNKQVLSLNPAPALNMILGEDGTMMKGFPPFEP